MRKRKISLVCMFILGLVVAVNLAVLPVVGQTAEVESCRRIDEQTYLVVCKTAEGTVQTISKTEYAPGDTLHIG